MASIVIENFLTSLGIDSSGDETNVSDTESNGTASLSFLQDESVDFTAPSSIYGKEAFDLATKAIERIDDTKKDVAKLADVIAAVKENMEGLQKELEKISKITKEHDIILSVQLEQNETFTDQIKTLQAAAFDKEIRMQEMHKEFESVQENGDEIKTLKICNYDKGIKLQQINEELTSVKSDVVTLKGALMTLVSAIKKNKEAGKSDQRTREKENRGISSLQLQEDAGKLLRRIIPGKGKPANTKQVLQRRVRSKNNSKKVVRRKTFDARR